MFVSVSIPTYFCAFLTWWSNESGNFSIWCFCAYLKKKGAVSLMLILKSGCAPLRITSLYNASRNGSASIPPDNITFSPFLTFSA